MTAHGCCQDSPPWIDKEGWMRRQAQTGWFEFTGWMRRQVQTGQLNF